MHDYEQAAKDWRQWQPVSEQQPVERRDFLRLTGFTLAALGLAGCSERKGGPAVDRGAALPYIQADESAVPGRPEHYASLCRGCPAGCGVLIKCRDGRPIKIEGLPDHPLSRGGLCAVGQAQVLGAYDSLRPSSPTAAGQPVGWNELDAEIIAGLRQARAGGKAIWLLTDSRNGPTDRWLIDRFRAAFDARHAVVDGLSTAAIAAAHEQTHGARVLPRYRFDRATAIVAFEADFLGTWLSPVEFTAGYVAARQPSATGAYSFHAQVESRLSLTGCNADLRQTVAPSALAGALADLLARVALRLGVGTETVAPDAFADQMADRLAAARAGALVVCGRNDLTCQLLTNQINLLLGGYGQTLDLEGASFQQYGDETALATLAAEIAAGQVGALLVAGANLVYSLPDGADWAKRLAAVPLTVSLAQRVDETAVACRYLAPEAHALESWGDAEPVNGLIGLQQPVLTPLRAGRSLAESLAAWLGQPAAGLDLVRAAWSATVLPRLASGAVFESEWRAALNAGFVAAQPCAIGAGAPRVVATTPPPPAQTGLELLLYTKGGVLDGRGAWNPWLQELPDPVSKVAWDNYASLGPATAKRLRVSDGDEVVVSTGGASVKLPVVVQVGQDERTVAVALGYGSSTSRRFAHIGPRWFGARPSVGADGQVGSNAAPLRAYAGGLLADAGLPVQVKRGGKRRQLAKTQTYDSLQVPAHLAPSGGGHRPIVQATTLAAYQRDPKSTDAHQEPEHDAGLTLWSDDHTYTGRHWAMVIDLNACTGCSACVLACQIENNVPVVGRDEVARRRELHWVRLDRYLDANGEHLDVSHQPMLCHHCGNAPCEVVCPVLATVHSAEGLNQQVYNRCVGTRYCANNCPYKTRRFNWFNYPHDDDTANLQLNPDVAIRSRGVMEKCTFCVQRLETAKAESARTGQPITDDDVQPACAQSCPARAIVFGDRNDPKSAVAKAMADPRRYVVLEELGIEPAVSYLRIVRNRPETKHG